MTSKCNNSVKNQDFFKNFSPMSQYLFIFHGFIITKCKKKLIFMNFFGVYFFSFLVIFLKVSLIDQKKGYLKKLFTNESKITHT